MPFIPEGVIRTLRGLKAQDYSDTFTRMVRSVETAGQYSYGKPVYTAGLSYPCRFTPKPSPDLLPGTEVQMTDAELFFASEVPLNGSDQVRITHLHGDKVTEQDYDIVAGPVVDSLGKSATLKLAQR